LIERCTGGTESGTYGSPPTSGGETIKGKKIDMGGLKTEEARSGDQEEDRLVRGIFSYARRGGTTKNHRRRTCRSVGGFEGLKAVAPASSVERVARWGGGRNSAVA